MSAFEWLSASLLGFLLFATLLIWTLKFSAKQESELKQRMTSWWYIFAALLGALWLPQPALEIFLAVVSVLALREYFNLIPVRSADKRAILWAYIAIPVQYLLAHFDQYGKFIVFIPVWMFLVIPIRMIITGDTKGFVAALSEIHWGLMINVFAVSHIAFLPHLNFANPNFNDPRALVLFLIVATELNDVFQYITGKLLGRRKIIPKVSPNKTWEGFLGGLTLTTVLFYFLGPVMTPLNAQMSVFLGMAVAVSGFFGDLSISALKRDIGVKDSGHLLPGHGGILDRIDSLCFTSLFYFHFLKFFAT